MTETSSDREVLRTRVLSRLRDVPDFPKPGITFKDITPVLGDAGLLKDLIAGLVAPWWTARITHVAGIESRGFILAAPMAIALGAAFIPIRKPGKLPWRTEGRAYALEYGVDGLEVHTDACPDHSRVLVVDDVLATGGTVSAACGVIRQVGGEVIGCSFLISIDALRGRALLHDTPMDVLVNV
ncbi:adenine phosphoribosyltransferase [soil metagenome]|jgi:adenine phosphoribosyltransferase